MWHVMEPVATVCVKKQSNAFDTVRSTLPPTAGALPGPPETDEMNSPLPPAVTAAEPTVATEVKSEKPKKLPEEPLVLHVRSMTSRHGTVV